MQLVMLLGAVFGIIGVESKSSSGTSPSAWSYAGVLCYAAGFCLLVVVLAKSISVVRLAPTRERILVPAVGLALPLVFVRLLYQILLVFVHSGHFVLIKGSVLVFVFMCVVEEFLVVCIFLLVGLRLERLDESQQGPILSRKRDRRRGRRHYRRGDSDPPL
jgi:hypothetical protein